MSETKPNTIQGQELTIFCLKNTGCHYRSTQSKSLFFNAYLAYFLLIININTYKIYKLSFFNLDNIEKDLKTKEVIFSRKNVQTVKNEFYAQGKMTAMSLYKIRNTLLLGTTMKTKNFLMVFIWNAVLRHTIQIFAILKII